jgi:pSer/pThr/pTyr-binding forkhead associated (FHA) protein
VRPLGSLPGGIIVQPLDLRDEQTGEIRTITAPRTVMGRADTADIPATGPRAGLASARHAAITSASAAGWVLTDLGSTNGTYVEGVRLTGPCTLKDGDAFSLGQDGPVYTVILPLVAKTIVERKSGDPDATVVIGEDGKERTVREGPAAAVVPRPARVERYELVLRRVRGGEELRANGRVLVLGRAPECDLPLRTDQDKIVSSRHAEFRFDDAGQASLADLGSRHGTWLGRRELHKPTPIRPGDHITIGRDGPEFIVEQLGMARATEAPRSSEAPAGQPQAPVSAASPASASGRKIRPTLAAMVRDARRAAAAQGGGTTMMAAALAEQLGARVSHRLRWIVGASAVVVVAVAALAYVLATRSVRAAARGAAEAREALADQVEEAGRMRERSDAEIRRLMQQIAAARQSRGGARTTDSLVRRVDSLRTQSASLATNVAVVRGLDIAAIVREHLPFLAAVRQGDLTASAYFLTADGYLLTSSEIGSEDESAEVSDTVFVHPGGREMQPLVAQVVAREGAFAVLKVGGYAGERPARVQWSPVAVRAGRAVAALGFVLGEAADSTALRWIPVRLGAAVLTADSGSATAEGVGPAPSLGAPVFDADGALLGIVADVQGEEARTFRIAMLSEVLPLLPAEVRRRLGIGR